MAWRQLIFWSTRSSSFIGNKNLEPGLGRFYSKMGDYMVKVGIPEFLKGVGKGLESHTEKLEAEIGDLQRLLVTRTIKLKRLGIRCQDRKLILKYAHKYRLGLWRPRNLPQST